MVLLIESPGKFLVKYARFPASAQQRAKRERVEFNITFRTGCVVGLAAAMVKEAIRQ
jgi:hypothetical protein